MTRGSILEYAEAVRGRYLRATKREKRKILDEFIQVTGYHRKVAIRLLHRGSLQQQRKRGGRRRRLAGRRPLSTTKPGRPLKSSIPIRTFADWEEGRPGFLEVDLVAHCGESTEGFYLTTLCAVDVASGWSECIGVWGKGQQRVGAAVHRVRQQLPFPLLGLDSDNGSEFINQHLYDYCRREGIVFTRSRSYKKSPE